MFFRKPLLVVAVLLCFMYGALEKQCAAHPQELQKPHFQVEHKAGILDIQATKDKAEVDVKSDTIRLVLKPGDSEIPLSEKPDIKVVHVENYNPFIAWRKKSGVERKIKN